MADKKPNLWLGHPIVSPSDAHDLEQRAAEFEFGHGMGRKDAEQKALHHYRIDQHRRAAAHHLNGMKMANAAGNQDAAKQHHAMYTGHMEAAGHDPMGAVPPEVKHYEPKPEKLYGHQPHAVDAYLQPKGESMGKAEWKVSNASEEDGYDHYPDKHRDEISAESKPGVSRAEATKLVSDRRRAPGGEWHVPDAKR